MKKALGSEFPSADITLTGGRSGSFEIEIDGKLIYSKLQTGAFPKPSEVTPGIKAVLSGSAADPTSGGTATRAAPADSGESNDCACVIC